LTGVDRELVRRVKEGLQHDGEHDPFRQKPTLERGGARMHLAPTEAFLARVLSET
jgi:hypothetical protein